MAFTKRVYTQKNKIYLYGAGTIVALFTFLVSLSYYGINISTSGDIKCVGSIAEPCVSYINLTTNRYAIVFPKAVIYFGDNPPTDYKLFKKDTLGRWRTFNISGKTMSNESKWELKLVGYKEINQTIKWGIKSGNTDIDPVWIGYTTDDFMPKLISNKADLTGGEAVFEYCNPMLSDVPFDSDKIAFTFNKVKGDFNTFEKSIGTKKQITVEKAKWNSIIEEKQVEVPYNGTDKFHITEYTTETIDNGFYSYYNVTEEIIDYSKLSKKVEYLKPNECKNILIKGTWNAGKTISIDWIPEIEVSGVKFKQYKFAWFNVSWSYVRPITITNSSVLSDYQVNVLINTTTNPNMNWSNNGSDIRFTYNDNTTVLSYWIENWNNATSPNNASIWVRTNQSNLNMWYGNPIATSQSDDWNTMVITPRISTLTKQTAARTGRNDSAYSLNIQALSNNYANVYTNISAGTNLMITGRMNTTYTSTASWAGGLCLYWNITDWACVGTEQDKQGYQYLANNVQTIMNTGTAASANTYYWYKIILNSTNIEFFRSADGVTYTSTNLTTNKWGGTAPKSVIIGKGYSSGTTYTNPYLANDLGSGVTMNTTYDNVIVRKYVTPEPTLSIGAEQTQPTVGITLYLNGTNADRFYELGNYINITACANVTGTTVYINTTHPSFTNPIVNGTTCATYLWNTSQVVMNQFNNSATSQNHSANNISGITINSVTDLQDGSMYLRGYLGNNITTSLTDTYIRTSWNESIAINENHSIYINVPKSDTVNSLFFNITGINGLQNINNSLSNAQSDINIGTGNRTRAGQRINIQNGIISGVGFYLKKIGTPTGNITFTVRNITTDAIIQTTPVISSSSLTTGFLWYYANFTTIKFLNEEVYIFTEYNYPRDDSNYISVSFYFTSSIISGYFVQWNNGVIDNYEGYDATINITMNSTTSNLNMSTNNQGIPYEYQYNGSFNSSSGSKQVSLNTTRVNSYLTSCSADSNGYCALPINIFSNTAGTIQISNISEIKQLYPSNLSISIGTTQVYWLPYMTLQDMYAITDRFKTNVTTKNLTFSRSGTNVTYVQAPCNAQANALSWNVSGGNGTQNLNKVDGLSSKSLVFSTENSSNTFNLYLPKSSTVATASTNITLTGSPYYEANGTLSGGLGGHNTLEGYNYKKTVSKAYDGSSILLYGYILICEFGCDTTGYMTLNLVGTSGVKGSCTTGLINGHYVSYGWGCYVSVSGIRTGEELWTTVSYSGSYSGYPTCVSDCSGSAWSATSFSGLNQYNTWNATNITIWQNGTNLNYQYLPELNSSVTLNVNLSSANMNSYLTTCTQDSCPVPYTVKTTKRGNVTISGVNVDYTNSISNITYDIANDGTIDASISGNNIPNNNVTIGTNGLNAMNYYIQRHCVNNSVSVPIIATSATAGTMALSNLVGNFSINPISLNVSAMMNYMNNQSQNTTLNTTVYSLCYQESANVSTACGGLSNGTYSSSGNWNDGDWGTFTNGAVTLYVNYTKNISANIAGSYWQIYDEGGGLVNVSLNTNCWSQNLIQLKITNTGSTVNWDCWSGSTWNVLQADTTTGNVIYEEAMWWNITNYVITYPKANIQVPIKYTSDNWGILNTYGLALNALTDYNYSFTGWSDSLHNATQTVKLIWSNFSMKFPQTWIDYTEFVPKSITSKNVTPTGQTDSNPIYNFTYLAREQPMNISIWLNESINSCVNITASTTSNKTDGRFVNTTSSNQIVSFNSSTTKGIWMWADLQCTYPISRWLAPNFMISSKCVSCN